MSNKTDFLSFEDVLNNHKKVLTESLVNFNEGSRVRKILLDVDSNSADYEYYFQSGQQSKQSKIEQLQKRIDKVVHILTYTNSATTTLCNDLIEI